MGSLWSQRKYCFGVQKKGSKFYLSFKQFEMLRLYHKSSLDMIHGSGTSLVPVDESLSAGNGDSIPGPGRFHRRWSN